MTTAPDDDFGIDIDDQTLGADDGDMDFGDDLENDFDDGVTDDFHEDPVRQVARKSGGWVFKLIVLVLLLGGGGYVAMNVLGIGAAPENASGINPTTIANLETNNAQMPPSQNQNVNDFLATDDLPTTTSDMGTTGQGVLAAAGITNPDVSDLMMDNADQNIEGQNINGQNMDSLDVAGLPPPPSIDDAIEAKSVLEEGFVPTTDADMAQNVGESEKEDLFDGASLDDTTTGLMALEETDATNTTSATLEDTLAAESALAENTDIFTGADTNTLDAFNDLDTTTATATLTEGTGLATELPEIDVTAEIKNTASEAIDNSVGVDTSVDTAMDIAADATTTSALSDVTSDTSRQKLVEIEKRLSDLESMIADFQKMVVTQDDLAALEKNIGSLKETVRAEQKSKPASAASEKTKASVNKKTPQKSSTAVVAKPQVKKQPTITKAWVLKSAKPGMAWVAPKGASGELKTVAIGDTISGIGRVTSIAKDGRGKWAVTGTQGVINQ